MTPGAVGLWTPKHFSAAEQATHSKRSPTRATQTMHTNMTSCSGKDYRSPPGSSYSDSLRHTLGLQWLHAGVQPVDLGLALFSNNMSLRRASLRHISLSLVPTDPLSHQPPPALPACQLTSVSKGFRITLLHRRFCPAIFPSSFVTLLFKGILSWTCLLFLLSCFF